jgi:hypothetical protein
MSNKEFTLWIAAIVAICTVVGIGAYASMQNTKTRTDAVVAKAQEHTKRAEGRHKLMDFLGLVNRKEEGK